MSKTTAVIILMFVACVVILGLSVMTLPGRETLGLCFIGGAVIAGFIVLFFPPKKQTGKS